MQEPKIWSPQVTVRMKFEIETKSTYPIPSIEDIEKAYLIRVLEWNRSSFDGDQQFGQREVAEFLGVNRKTLCRKLKQYGLEWREK